MLSTWHDLWRFRDFSDLEILDFKVLRDKEFNIAKIQTMIDWWISISTWFIGLKPFCETSSDIGAESKIMLNQRPLDLSCAAKVSERKRQIAEELHKSIIRKFKNWKVYSSFKDNILGVDLADMKLISKINKRFHFLLFVIDMYSKYAWVVPLKDKKGIIITNAFQKILGKSNHKPNKKWVDKDSKF